MNNVVFTCVKRPNGSDDKHSPVFHTLLHVSAVLTVVLCEVPVDVLKHLQIQQATNSLLLAAKIISLPRPELWLSSGTSVLSTKDVIAVWKNHIPELVETLTTAELLQYQSLLRENNWCGLLSFSRSLFKHFCHVASLAAVTNLPEYELLTYCTLNCQTLSIPLRVINNK